MALKTCFKLSIVVLVYNEIRHIRRLISNLEKCSKGISVEYIFIDSGSNDSSDILIRQLTRKWTNTRLIQIEKKQFDYGETRNIATCISRGKYICFISAHVIIKNKKSLQFLIEDIENNRNVVAAYGFQTITKNNWLADLESEYRYLRLSSYISDKENILIQNIDQLNKYIQSDELFLLYFISNTFAVYRKDYLIKYKFANLHKLNLTRGEDIILGKRIIELGLNKVFDPRCIFIHEHNYNFQNQIINQIEDYKVTKMLKLHSRINLIQKINLLCKKKRFKYIFVIIFVYFVKACLYFYNSTSSKK